jgi:hypothetical protein
MISVLTPVMTDQVGMPVGSEIKRPPHSSLYPARLAPTILKGIGRMGLFIHMDGSSHSDSFLETEVSMGPYICQGIWLFDPSEPTPY